MKHDLDPRLPVDMIIIIGAMKCGTTTLFDYLAQSPQVCECQIKESMFFSSDERFGRGYRWYRSLFDINPIAHRYILDGSSDCAKYPFCGDVGARIRSSGARSKLIYIIRNPLRRIESHLRHAEMSGSQINEIRSDRESFSLEFGLSEAAIDISRYATQLDQFMEWWVRGDIHIVSLEELVADEQRVLKRIFTFLQLDFPTLQPPIFENRAGERKELVWWAAALRRQKVIGNLLSRITPESIKGRSRQSIEPQGRFELNRIEEASIIAELMSDLCRLDAFYGFEVEKWWGIKLEAP